MRKELIERLRELAEDKVRLFDGTTLECSEDVEAIYAAVEKVRGEA